MADTEKLLLDTDESAGLYGVSVRQFYKLRAAGKVPPPIYLTPTMPRYRRSDLIASIEAMATSKPAGEPVQLRKARKPA